MMIGIRGSLTIEIAMNPRIESRSEEATITETVHKVVFPTSFASFKRYTAMITEKKRSGRSVNLPILMTISVINARIEAP